MKAVAIIGIGCRYPSARGPKAFWDLLLERRDAISVLSKERKKLSRLFDSLTPDALENFFGGFLDGIENFDAEFFQVSPREAVCLDPQQRMLMQVVWEAFEDAGIIPARLKGSSTGVFIGASTHEYSIRSFMNLDLVTPYTGIGNSSGILANRISYQLDLHGPSLAVDTACSSSLVAVHLACEYLQENKTSIAVAGGVNLILAPQGNEMFSQAKALAPNGRCKTFDAKADGIVRSDGLGIVILKPLDQAIADGDPIYAVIRGSAINQDGRTNGLMAPNRWAQEKVLQEALEDAHIAPIDVQYVEAHGTGTLLGDPIEASALGAVFSPGRDPLNPLGIGSIKTNIGHTETAAGVAGLIKVALSLKHGLIPSSLHFQDPNPYIAFDKLKLKVISDPKPWRMDSGKKPIAGVSSFGFGGTNAHILLEQYAEPGRGSAQHKSFEESAVLFPLSARTEAALKCYARNYVEYLNNVKNPSQNTLRTIAYNASCRRTHFEKRIAVAAKNLEELKGALLKFAESETKPAERVEFSSSKIAPALVFSGQGSQWHGMALQLLKQEEVFRRKMNECDRLIQEEAGWSLLTELAGKNFEKLGEKYQPMIFAISVSLAELWATWGILPNVVVGHSLGEVAAAQVAGMLTLADAVKIICRRSCLMTRLEGKGAMAIFELTREEAESAIALYGSQVAIGASNGPKSVVLTGESALIANLITEFEARGVFAKQVKTEVACHSVQVDSIKEELRRSLATIHPLPGTCRFYSTVTNRLMEGSELGADYWAENIRQPVLFFESISNLIHEGSRTFIELSPHPLLITQIQETAKFVDVSNVLVFGSLRRERDEQGELFRSLSGLYESGAVVCWEKLFKDTFAHERIPTYPWQEQEYWMEESLNAGSMMPRHPGLQGVEVPSADSRHRKQWNIVLSGRQHQFMFTRLVQKSIVFPGSGFVEMGLQLAQKTFKNQAIVLRNIEFQRPLVLHPELETHLQLVSSSITQAGSTFEVYSQAKENRSRSKEGFWWEPHARGAIEVSHSAVPSSAEDGVIAILQRLQQSMKGAEFYQKLAALGHHYGDVFQGIQSIHSSSSEALAELSFNDPVIQTLDHYIMHPAILDSCFQGILGLGLLDAGTVLPDFWLKSIGEVKWFSKGVPKWSHLKLDPATRTVSITLLDLNGFPLSQFSEIRFEGAVKKEDRISWPKRVEDWMYDLRWEVGLMAPKPLSRPSSESESRTLKLIFCDQDGVGEELAKKCNDREVWLIHPGKSFKKLSRTGEFQIDPLKASDYKLFFTALKNRLKMKPLLKANVELVHLFSLDLKQTATMAQSRIPIFSLLQLLKGFEKMSLISSYKIWIATSGAQTVSSHPHTTHFFQTPTWGLSRSLMEEHHAQFGKIIDLDPDSTVENSALTILGELLSDDAESQVAYRSGTRLVPRMMRMPSKKRETLLVKLKPDRTYLLTGGRGRLGVVAARWMIRKGARRLLVLGRSKVPDRRLWKGMKRTNSAYSRVRTILELEKLGCQIDYRMADVADDSSIQKLVGEYRSLLLPEIAGVVHAASVIFAKTFVETTQTEMENVLKTKIDGTWNLHRAFQQSSGLDFFVVFSSISTWLSSSYLGVYAAANSFLDGITHHRRSLGLPGLVINFGKWAENEESHQLADKKVGTIPLVPGIEILEDLIGNQIDQAGVAVVHWPHFKSHYPRISSAPFLSSLMGEIAEEEGVENFGVDLIDKTIRATLESLPGKSRIKKLEEYIVGIIAKAMKCQTYEVSVTQPLNTIGLDSMIALEIKNAIIRDVGVTVPIVRFLTGINVIELAAQLANDVTKSAELKKTAAKHSAVTRSIDLDTLSSSDLDKILFCFEKRCSDEKRAAA